MGDFNCHVSSPEGRWIFKGYSSGTTGCLAFFTHQTHERKIGKNNAGKCKQRKNNLNLSYIYIYIYVDIHIYSRIKWSFRLKSKSFAGWCFGVNLQQNEIYLLVVIGHVWLGGGFNDFLFSPLPGEDSHFWLIFFNWVETTNQMVICWEFAVVQSTMWPFFSIP